MSSGQHERKQLEILDSLGVCQDQVSLSEGFWQSPAEPTKVDEDYSKLPQDDM